MPSPFKNPKNGSEITSHVSSFPAFFSKRKPPIIASNIWSFLHQLIIDTLSKDKLSNKACAYLEQSFEFFEAAKNPRTGSKPLLYYYSFLNLAKTYLLFKKIDFPNAVKHGVCDPRENEREKLKLQGQSIRINRINPNHSQLFPEFICALGGVPPIEDIKIVDLLSKIPGIHMSYSSIAKRSPSFIPIEKKVIQFNNTEVWTQIALKKENRNEYDRILKLKANNTFSTYFHQISCSTDKEVWFESVPESGRNRGIDNAIKRIQTKINRIGIWSVLTNKGYRYYLSTFSNWLPQLASMYAVMFYLGSITRYRPHDFDKILRSKYSWLIEEFINTQPTQFLYILASTLAEVDVVKPFSVYD
jgi:hypothetical protein